MPRWRSDRWNFSSPPGRCGSPSSPPSPSAGSRTTAGTPVVDSVDRALAAAVLFTFAGRFLMGCLEPPERKMLRMRKSGRPAGPRRARPEARRRRPCRTPAQVAPHRQSKRLRLRKDCDVEAAPAPAAIRHGRRQELDPAPPTARLLPDTAVSTPSSIPRQRGPSPDRSGEDTRGVLGGHLHAGSGLRSPARVESRVTSPESRAGYKAESDAAPPAADVITPADVTPADVTPAETGGSRPGVPDLRAELLGPSAEGIGRCRRLPGLRKDSGRRCNFSQPRHSWPATPIW